MEPAPERLKAKRIELYGTVIENAAKALAKAAKARGVNLTSGAFRQSIYRWETGRTKQPDSDLWPIWLELLGLKPDDPAISDWHAKVDQRLALLEAAVFADQAERGIAPAAEVVTLPKDRNQRIPKTVEEGDTSAS